MPYVTSSQVTAKIPAPILNDALDDDGDGVADSGLLDSIIATASQEVDGYLAGLFTVPFADPAPAPVAQAALCFTLETIYGRRNQSGDAKDPNPYKSQAKAWRDHLQKVGNRDLPLDASKVKAFVPGAAVTDCVSLNAQST